MVPPGVSGQRFFCWEAPLLLVSMSCTQIFHRLTFNDGSYYCCININKLSVSFAPSAEESAADELKGKASSTENLTSQESGKEPDTGGAPMSEW